MIPEPEDYHRLTVDPAMPESTPSEYKPFFFWHKRTVDPAKPLARRDWWHLWWFGALGIICFALGYSTAWQRSYDQAHEVWRVRYEHTIEEIKTDLEDKFGLRETDMPGIGIYDLVGGAHEPPNE